MYKSVISMLMKKQFPIIILYTAENNENSDVFETLTSSLTDSPIHSSRL